jgi:hypothetical protein
VDTGQVLQKPFDRVEHVRFSSQLGYMGYIKQRVIQFMNLSLVSFYRLAVLSCRRSIPSVHHTVISQNKNPGEDL